MSVTSLRQNKSDCSSKKSFWRHWTFEVTVQYHDLEIQSVDSTPGSSYNLKSVTSTDVEI